MAKQNLTGYVDSSLRRKVVRRAKRKGVSISQVLEDILINEFSRHWASRKRDFSLAEFAIPKLPDFNNDWSENQKLQWFNALNNAIDLLESC